MLAWVMLLDALALAGLLVRFAVDALGGVLPEVLGASPVATPLLLAFVLLLVLLARDPVFARVRLWSAFALWALASGLLILGLCRPGAFEAVVAFHSPVFDDLKAAETWRNAGWLALLAAGLGFGLGAPTRRSQRAPGGREVSPKAGGRARLRLEWASLPFFFALVCGLALWLRLTAAGQVPSTSFIEALLDVAPASRDPAEAFAWSLLLGIGSLLSAASLARVVSEALAEKLATRTRSVAPVLASLLALFALLLPLSTRPLSLLAWTWVAACTPAASSLLLLGLLRRNVPFQARLRELSHELELPRSLPGWPWLRVVAPSCLVALLGLLWTTGLPSTGGSPGAGPRVGQLAGSASELGPALLASTWLLALVVIPATLVLWPWPGSRKSGGPS
jgi:hypothetical protein